MEAEEIARNFYKQMERELEKEKAIARYLMHMDESHYHLSKAGNCL